MWENLLRPTDRRSKKPSLHRNVFKLFKSNWHPHARPHACRACPNKRKTRRLFCPFFFYLFIFKSYLVKCVSLPRGHVLADLSRLSASAIAPIFIGISSLEVCRRDRGFSSFLFTFYILSLFLFTFYILSFFLFNLLYSFFLSSHLFSSFYFFFFPC